MYFVLILGMDYLQQILRFISITALIFLVLGLYRPWVMLWWEDVQNRRKVIRLYGTVAGVAYLASCIFKLF